MECRRGHLISGPLDSSHSWRWRHHGCGENPGSAQTGKSGDQLLAQNYGNRQCGRGSLPVFADGQEDVYASIYLARVCIEEKLWQRSASELQFSGTKESVTLLQDHPNLAACMTLKSMNDIFLRQRTRRVLVVGGVRDCLGPTSGSQNPGGSHV